MVITALLIVIITVSNHIREEEILTSADPHNWVEMGTWSLADRKFPSYPVKPLLLYKDDKMNKAIYVHDGMLLFHSLLDDQTEGTTIELE